MAPPNILLLMTDQQRFDSLGCYGLEAAHTPNLDGLATGGVLFEQDYVNNPICTPSRASIMTGQHLPGHGVYRLYDNLPHDQVLFPEYLRQAGYRTALFGKLHVSSNACEAEQRHPHDGFDTYEWCNEGCLLMDSPFHGYSQWLKERDPDFHERLRREKRGVTYLNEEHQVNRWAADRTIDFLECQTGEQPFFCKVSVFDPHDPYDSHPRHWEEKVDGARLPDPDRAPGDFEGKPPVLKRTSQSSYLGSMDDYSTDDLRRMRLGYHASVAYLDHEFGRVLEALERKGLADNTLVIFTSDHGDMLGDHHQLVKGGCFYDASVRVPLIMRWPGHLPGGQRIATPVQNHDLAATILGAAGIETNEVEARMPDSRNLLPLARGECDAVHDAVYCCLRNSTLSSEPSATPYYDPPIHGTMMHTGQYKLNRWHQQGTGATEPAGELYDMQSDPDERRNLWSEPKWQGVRRDLCERMADWLFQQEQRHGSRGGETVPANRRPAAQTSK